MKALNTLFFFLVLLSAATAVEAQCIPASMFAGSLDTCFDGDGKVFTGVTDRRDFGYAVVVQPDGKILVAASAAINPSAGNPNNGDFAVIRYNPDGSLDTTFDGDGIALVTVSDFSHDNLRAMALQPDGKIVLVGMTGFSFHTEFAVARLNPNGSLDTAFASTGKLRTNLGSSSFDDAKAVLVQPDGKIVVVGETKASSQTAIHGAVVRYNANGSLDTTFGTGGVATFTTIKTLYAVRQQADGKLVVAGTNNFLAVARVNTNGSLDTSFGTNGVASFSSFNISDVATAMVIEADGKIVAGGSSRVQESGGYFCAPLVRFSVSGVIEASSVNCNDAPGNTVINALALQTDGKIVAAGQGWRNPWRGFLIMRYNHALSLDYPFNNGEGAVHIGELQFQAMTTATAVALQSDNKIVATGWFVNNGFEEFSPVFSVRVNAGIVAPHLRSPLFDYDGDGKADVSVFRPSTDNWYIFQSSNAQVTEQIFGLSGDIVAPADFDGDGKTDLGIFRPSGGDWWFKSSITGVFNSAQWGQTGDIPRPSDFDGDGKADYVLFRPSNNSWYRFGSSVGAVATRQFGLPGDKPVVGDFDDDNRADMAIFRPSTGDWWWQSSNDNIQRATHWGISTDVPAPADFDGDGKTDFAVYRPSTGVWYIANSSNGSFTIINFGLAEDKPVPADYDGDGKADIAVFRPSTGVWYQLRSTAGFAAMQFGISTDVPTPNAYIP